MTTSPIRKEVDSDEYIEPQHIASHYNITILLIDFVSLSVQELAYHICSEEDIDKYWNLEGSVNLQKRIREDLVMCLDNPDRVFLNKTSFLSFQIHLRDGNDMSPYLQQQISQAL